ncbi:MAG: hypothetical protein QME62_04500 [Armatimonadota bacterium]|nr:hypothetical protein [Armatimonadota bacterium]
MRLTERVKNIIELNLQDSYIPFVVQANNSVRIFPMYYARIIGEDIIAFPVTNATGIEETLKGWSKAYVVVSDRAAGYEAYVLEGRGRYESNETDYELVAEMRNVVPGFPIHGAVVFKVENCHLAPPP